MRCEIAAKDPDRFGRGWVCSQWLKAFDDIGNALAVVSQDIEEVVGILVLTAEVERQRLENDVGSRATDPNGAGRSLTLDGPARERDLRSVLEC